MYQGNTSVRISCLIAWTVILLLALISPNTALASTCIGNNYEQQMLADGVQPPYVTILGNAEVNEGEILELTAQEWVTRQTVAMEPAAGSVFDVGQPVEIRWSSSPYEVERVDLKFMPAGEPIAKLTGAGLKSGSYTWYPTRHDLTDKGQIQVTVWTSNCAVAEARSAGYFEIRNAHDPSGAWERAERISDYNGFWGGVRIGRSCVSPCPAGLRACPPGNGRSPGGQICQASVRMWPDPSASPLF